MRLLRKAHGLAMGASRALCEWWWSWGCFSCAVWIWGWFSCAVGVALVCCHGGGSRVLCGYGLGDHECSQRGSRWTHKPAPTSQSLSQPLRASHSLSQSLRASQSLSEPLIASQRRMVRLWRGYGWPWHAVGWAAAEAGGCAGAVWWVARAVAGRCLVGGPCVVGGRCVVGVVVWWAGAGRGS